ncbi:MAG TPA: alpha/beta hydrolase [Ktedonosporobacter sp.]|nr:alpha/beta hydrolase [Ktedonosporobacter sp.]
MKTFWTKHTWLRRTLYTIVALLALCMIVLSYIAYIYMPPEDRTHQPAYLTQIQAQHLDGYVDAGKFRLHYLHQGSGEPVVLLPGGGAWIYDMRQIVAALAPHYSVYAIDPPGDGYTTPLAQNPDYNSIYTLDSIDQSLLAFMNNLHILRAAFVGNSWGGGYALYFTERHPERVSKYVSLDGTGLDIPDTFFWQLTAFPVVGEVYTKLTVSPDAVRQFLQAVTVHTQITDDMVQEFSIPYSFHSNLASWWTLERNLHWSVTEQLILHMKTPILVIWGKQDAVLDPGLYLPRWRQLAPTARVVEIDQAGHLVHDDQPEQVNQLLLNFLAQS